MSCSALTHALLLVSAPLRLDEVPPEALMADDAQVASGQTRTGPGIAVPDVVVPDVAVSPAVQPPAQPPAAATVLPPADTTASDPSDIVVNARPRVAGDPLQQVNAKAFAVTQAVDDAVVGPAARAYERTVPAPLRDGLRNFFNNLHEPVIALNFLLQLKPGKAAETLGRFAVNSTVGGAGVFDVAKRRAFKLPRRRNGFANTFGFYGIKSGPFLFLPFVGPTTLRDLVGGTLDGFVLPLAVGAPFNQPSYTIPTGLNRGLDRRAELEEQIAEGRKVADPYAATREGYLKRRQAEIDKLPGRHGEDGTAVPPPQRQSGMTPS